MIINIISYPFPVVKKTTNAISIQCGAPKIAKLVYNSNNYGLWYANNYSIHGVNLNQRSHHWGARHLRHFHKVPMFHCTPWIPGVWAHPLSVWPF